MDYFTRYTFDSDGGLHAALQEHASAYAAREEARVNLEKFNATYLQSWEGDAALTQGERIARNKLDNSRFLMVKELSHRTQDLIEKSAALVKAWDVIRTQTPD